MHASGDRRWIGLPSKPLLDPDGRHRVDADDKKQYVPVVEIPDRGIRERFQTAALAAVDRLLASEGSRENAGVAPREFRAGSAP